MVSVNSPAVRTATLIRRRRRRPRAKKQKCQIDGVVTLVPYKGGKSKGGGGGGGRGRGGRKGRRNQRKSRRRNNQPNRRKMLALIRMMRRLGISGPDFGRRTRRPLALGNGDAGPNMFGPGFKRKPFGRLPKPTDNSTGGEMQKISLPFWSDNGTRMEVLRQQMAALRPSGGAMARISTALTNGETAVSNRTHGVTEFMNQLFDRPRRDDSNSTRASTTIRDAIYEIFGDDL